jgi:hypothetical protein
VKFYSYAKRVSEVSLLDQKGMWSFTLRWKRYMKFHYETDGYVKCHWDQRGTLNCISRPMGLLTKKGSVARIPTKGSIVMTFRAYVTSNARTEAQSRSRPLLAPSYSNLFAFIVNNAQFLTLLKNRYTNQVQAASRYAPICECFGEFRGLWLNYLSLGRP